MPRLRQLLKTPGGQLAETSSEELAKLSGRSQAPTTPLETAVIGGEPHTSKMAGTPAQKVSALRTALQEEDVLTTRLRREQVRRKATGEEAKAIEQAGRLEQLGDLESRVEQLAEQALARGTEQQQAVELGITTEDEKERELLERIRDNPQDNEAIVEYNRLMGRTTVASQLSAEEILGRFGDEAGAVGGALAESVQDKITSGELDFKDMGFTSIDEVAGLLGTDAKQLSGMSIQQMQDQLNAQIADEYDTVDTLNRQANDPALGAAERAEARKTLREMGAVGIRSIESDIDNLADDIAEAETVEFMGEEMQIEELLDDDYLSGVVGKYMTDKNFAKQLKEEEPQLVEFIERHKGALADAAKDVEAGLLEFADLQQRNQNLAKSKVGKLSNDIMKEMIPGFGELSATEFKAPPAIKMLKSNKYTAQEKSDFYDSIKFLHKEMGPKYIRELSNLDPSSIQGLGLLDKDSDAFKRTESYMLAANKVKNLQYGDPENFAKTMGAENYNDLQQTLAEAEKKQRSGFFGEEEGLADLRGIIRPGESIDDNIYRLKKAYLKKGKNKYSLQDLLKAPAPDAINKFTDTKKYTTKANHSYNIVESAFNNDARIDIDELRKIGEDSNLDDLNTIYKDDLVKSKADDSFQEEMINIGSAKFEPRDIEIQGITGFNPASLQDKTFWENETNYKEILKSSDNYIKALTAERDSANSRDDKLTVDVVNKQLARAEKQKREFQDRRNFHVQATAAPTLAPEKEREKSLEEDILSKAAEIERRFRPAAERHIPRPLRELGGPVSDVTKAATKEMGKGLSKLGKKTLRGSFR